jgi:hypothetical protein
LTGHFTLLSWGFASAALLGVGMALALGGGPAVRRLAGSTFLKASCLVLAGFGWGALGPGGRAPAPSALAAFTVVFIFLFLLWGLEFVLAMRLEEEEPEKNQPRPAPMIHRAKDFVRRYPEKFPNRIAERETGGDPPELGGDLPPEAGGP